MEKGCVAGIVVATTGTEQSSEARLAVDEGRNADTIFVAPLTRFVDDGIRNGNNGRAADTVCVVLLVCCIVDDSAAAVEGWTAETVCGTATAISGRV